ncbi:protein C8orf4 homolog [Sinocyclocheilus anshuiensis]|uniref:protein C8orf4 homolog n=1 Tax=Sinocyclocheilus anshuiensis TaxID=1608454 RepID=UPI0007B7A1EA|nr:PREDICTED: protein C8orf4 homolog [Sinocyclocheilus anshuiensis]
MGVRSLAVRMTSSQKGILGQSPIKPAVLSNAVVTESTAAAIKHRTSRKRSISTAMSSYASSYSRRVNAAVSGVKFGTAHRKKASPNIFENVNQDALVKLFEKAGDLKAAERARSILALHQDPEGISRALMASKLQPNHIKVF